MTTEPHPDYAPLRCKTHDKAYCEECMMISSEASTQLSLKQSAYSAIGKVDWTCHHHKNARFIYVCETCVQEQLEAEYERGRADQRAETTKQTP